MPIRTDLEGVRLPEGLGRSSPAMRQTPRLMLLQCPTARILFADRLQVAGGTRSHREEVASGGGGAGPQRLTAEAH